MGEYFLTLTEGIRETPWGTWLVLAAAVAMAVGIIIAAQKLRNTKLTVGLSIAAFAITAVLIFLFIPQITPESAQDGGLTQAGSFLYSPWFLSVIFCVIGMGAVILLLRNQKMTASMLVTGALCVTVSFVLSCIAVYRLPNGGTITPASMLPVMLFAYLYGPVPGMAAGLVHGILQLMQGAYVIHPVQFILDYMLPFTLLGLAGIFRKSYRQFMVGLVVGAFARFICHMVSGQVFFYMYAAPGQSVFVYNLLYNGSYMLPETIICLGVAIIPQFRTMVERLKVRALGNATPPAK